MVHSPSTASLHDWFRSSLGEYLLARERAWLDQVVPDIFGFHAVQLGLPQFDVLHESRISHRVTVNPEGNAGAGVGVLAQWYELPFETQSVDLCLLPHVLEFTENPHEVLREIDRVMRPEGRILILGFNPWSLFGTRRLLSSKGFPGRRGVGRRSTADDLVRAIPATPVSAGSALGRDPHSLKRLRPEPTGSVAPGRPGPGILDSK